MVNTMALESAQSSNKMRIVNDFSIQVATVNGSGSQLLKQYTYAVYFSDGHTS